jgi:hypothetical protein
MESKIIFTVASTATTGERHVMDIFRRLIKRAFCSQDLRAQLKHNVMLDKPLGSWYQTERHVLYDAYMARNVICVRQKAHGPSIYDRLVSPQNLNYFIYDGIRKTLPFEAHPAELIETSEGKFQPKWHFSSVINHQAREDEKRTDEEEEEAECENVDELESAEGVSSLFRRLI